MSQIDLKKMTKEMISKKVKSKINEFYNEKKNIDMNENNQKKENKVVDRDDYYEEEQEQELEPIQDNIKNTFVQKQEENEINYFYLMKTQVAALVHG